MLQYSNVAVLFVWVGVICSLVSLSEAVLPQSQITTSTSSSSTSSSSGKASTSTTWLASNALYGPWAAMVGRNGLSTTNYPLVHLTHEDTHRVGLCLDDDEDDGSSIIPSLQDAIVVVPRGNCTYQTKTWVAQQYGAKGVIVYNTLASRYGYNESTMEIQWPLAKHDYECDNGMAYIPMDELGLGFGNGAATGEQQQQTPYFSELDALLSGNDKETNLCAKYANSDFFRKCTSNRCYLTGNTSTTTTSSSSAWQACCAWDQHLYLYPDSDLQAKYPEAMDITIPTVMITLQQGQELLDQWNDAKINNDSLYVSIASRWKLNFNLSALLIWMLGVGVCTLASYLSAGDFHKAIARRLGRGRRRHRSSFTDHDGGDTDDTRTGLQSQTLVMKRSAIQEETLELEPIHAIGFIIMASTSLIVLFYFEIYGIVKVFYAFGCCNAVIQILLVPCVERLWFFLKLDKKLIYRATPPQEGEEEPVIPDISNIDAVAMILGYTWGGLWLYLAFTLPHNVTTTFFWVSQNIFGTCMCCLFLQIIQLNAIQVASILLVVAFFYDIFFVFITPYLTKGGESIMITVATSGGPPKAGEDWCEKYPTDPNCQGGDPLPMLLTMPRFFDYEGGSSLLGLGDIVLPGLLLSFAARLDAAKTLVALVTPAASDGRDHLEHGETTSSSTWGYFGPLVVAYGVGLLMANAAVYFMHMGQPALLYLVPCCLGTMVVLGYRRSELLQLWQGPTVLQVADVITYGKRPTDATNGDTAMMGSGDEGGGGGNVSTFSSAAVTSSSLEPLDGSSGIMVELSFQQQQQQQQPMEEDDEMGRTPLLVSASASPSLGGGKNPNQS